MKAITVAEHAGEHKAHFEAIPAAFVTGYLKENALVNFFNLYPRETLSLKEKVVVNNSNASGQTTYTASFVEFPDCSEAGDTNDSAVFNLLTKHAEDKYDLLILVK